MADPDITYHHIRACASPGDAHRIGDPECNDWPIVDTFSELPLDVLTPAALLGLAILLILRGALVPRSQVDKQLADKDAQIAEKMIQIANKDEQIKVSLDQNSSLIRANETTMHLIESLQRTLALPPTPPAGGDGGSP